MRTGGITLAMLGIDSLEDATLRHLQRVARHCARQHCWAGKDIMMWLNGRVLPPTTKGVQCEAHIKVWDAARDKTCEAVLPGVAALYVPGTVDAPFGQRTTGKWLAEATLARAAAKLGADYKPFAAKEARPKDTDAVDGSTQDGDQTHGGDSASGEVLDGESGAGEGDAGQGQAEGDEGEGSGEGQAEGQAEGQGQGGARASDGEGGGSDVSDATTAEGAGRQGNGAVPPETGQATSGQGNGTAQSPPDPAEARSPEGAPEASSGTTAVSGPRANGSSARAQVDADTGCDRKVDSEDRVAESPLGDTEGGALDGGAGTPQEESPSASPAGPSTSARRAHGGVFAHMALRAERPLVRAVRAHLQRLVGDAVQDDGPRMDVARSVSRLLARRSDWVVRREEQGRPALLVLVDVSGSCSAFCRDSVRVAAAVAADGLQGADVLVVVHSNGYPEEAVVNNTCLPAPPRFVRYGEGMAPITAWYADHITSHNIRHILVLGDGDGEWLYRDLAHRGTVERILWLDGYRARVYGGPRAIAREAEGQRQQLRKGGWTASAARKVAYVSGCGDADQFAEALRLAIQQGG